MTMVFVIDRELTGKCTNTWQLRSTYRRRKMSYTHPRHHSGWANCCFRHSLGHSKHELSESVNPSGCQIEGRSTSFSRSSSDISVANLNLKDRRLRSKDTMGVYETSNGLTSIHDNVRLIFAMFQLPQCSLMYFRGYEQWDTWPRHPTFEVSHKR